MQLRKNLAALALALTLLLSLSVPALAQAVSREESALQAATYAMQYGGAQSIQYAVWEDGEITLAGQAGAYSRTENRALTAENLYGIGSVSKVYTTAAVMKLVEQGRIHLDAPVTRYLPQFTMSDGRYKQITVRMLLNHSSGLMGTTSQNAFLFDDSDRSATTELLAQLAPQRLKADPGAYSVYCNDGFTLAELVVEAVSGQTFPAYLRSTFFQPNGLSASVTAQDEFDRTLLAKAYLGEESRALSPDAVAIIGTGGIYTSASDLATFGGLLTGDKLLGTDSRKAMASAEYARGIWPTDAPDSISYGLGWDSVEFFPFSQSGIQALVKGGDTLQYHGGLIVLPEHKMAVAVLSSGGISTYNELAGVRMLIDALKAKGIAVDERIPALPTATPAAMPKEVMAHAGYYNSTSMQMKIDITAEGKLSIQSLTMPSAPVQEFFYHSDGSFRETSGTALVKLVTEKSGQTYLYQRTFSPIPGLSPLPTSNYAAVRAEGTPADATAQAAWDAAIEKGFLLLNEKASSQLWPQAFVGATELPESIPGYIGAARIVSATEARYEPQVPGVSGRDGMDQRLEERNGVTYFTLGNSVFADSSILRPIYGGVGAYCTIQTDGYARWYSVGKYGGHAMSVTMPEGSGFTVYDEQGVATASSAAWGDSGAKLPEGGYVVFVGDAGDRFQLAFTA